jgi:hypothetical protein
VGRWRRNEKGKEVSRWRKTEKGRKWVNREGRIKERSG